MNDIESVVHHVAVLGSYEPRRCGIATFSADLTEALDAAGAIDRCTVVALNDPGNIYAYPSNVRFEIAQADHDSYRRAADFLNVGQADVLSLQHEYGIFGGVAGRYILTLLRDLRIPIVTTLHTVLAEPSPDQRDVLDELVQLSSRLVVMSSGAGAILQKDHDASADRIDIIPHGIPDLRSVKPSKALLGLEGRPVILTFGLLSPDKGIEYVIECLPAVLAKHPEAVYVLVGATHPQVKQRSGDAYRRGLEFLARRLGVESSVLFQDRFVTVEELTEFLAAADIYVTPYLSAEQSTSGTLAYAVGAGKAVVSTPYPYAKELLAEGRGVLVPVRDAAGLSEALVKLLDNPEQRAAMSQRTARMAAEMAWPTVANRYLLSFEQAKQEHRIKRQGTEHAKTLGQRPLKLPELNLEHLQRMTDDTGLLQHAAYAIPRYADGYCLDDNARALLLMAMLEDSGTDYPKTVRELGSRYLAFVAYALDPATGAFRNFMSFDRRWQENKGSEDSQGRALWALGAMVGRSPDPGRRSLARDLFIAALPAIDSLTTVRGWAYSLLGVHEYLRAFDGDSAVARLCERLAERLYRAFELGSGRDWCWCEDALYYDNPRLPQALIVAGARLGDAEMTATGVRALGWLARVQSGPDGRFTPIGSNGFYPRKGLRANFDQQPIEACAMVGACRDAWIATGDQAWIAELHKAFAWYFGHNVLQMTLYQARTGGCRDGLHADRVNLNEGAESTLSFLLALADMRLLDGETRIQRVESLAKPKQGVGGVRS